MTRATIARVDLIREATALEKAGGEWKLRHVLAVLDCHKATLYRNRWLMARAIRQPGGVAFKPTDIRLYQANNTGDARRRGA
jgi:hypothetical protein